MSTSLLFTRVGYNYVPTTNIDASVDWYVNHLGLQLIQKFEDRGSMIAVLHYPHKNAIAVLLIETKECRPLEISRNGRPFPIMAMNCPNIEYTRYFYFRDNEGNLLEGAWSIWDTEDEIHERFLQDSRS